MGNAETLTAVIQQLREIFLEKSELKGYDDWDKFLGCIAALQQVAQSLTEPTDEPRADTIAPEAEMIAEE